MVDAPPEEVTFLALVIVIEELMLFFVLIGFSVCLGRLRAVDGRAARGARRHELYGRLGAS